MRRAGLVSTLVIASCVACASDGPSASPSGPPDIGVPAILDEHTAPSTELLATAPSASPTTAPELTTPASTPTSTAPAPSMASTDGHTASEPTGAPGIDDDDAFCAAWARIIGTEQLLVVAANFGELASVELARLEVVAAPAVALAASTLTAAFPAQLDVERDVYLGRVISPFVGRADRARLELTTAGATEADLAVLVDAWLDALRRRDPADPVPRVAMLDDRLAAIVDAASRQFSADVAPILDDPSLIASDIATPAVDAYLAATCPDLSDLGIGDAI